MHLRQVKVTIINVTSEYVRVGTSIKIIQVYLIQKLLCAYMYNRTVKINLNTLNVRFGGDVDVTATL